MVLLKKIFNRFFPDNIKELIRSKMSKLLENIDKRIIYKEYKKACIYILKKKIFGYKGNDYGYQQDFFMKYVKKELIRTKIRNENILVRDEDMEGCLKYTRDNDVDIYCGCLDNIKIYKDDCISYDEDNELFYGLYEGKKLYFDEAVNSKERALEALNGLAAEQIDDSPHQYLYGDFQVEPGDVVFDIGCADGNFSLSIIDKASKVYLFEADEHWMKPLQLTFAPYKDKIVIVKKYVSDKTSEYEISLDDFCRNGSIENIDLIKMDVEGYEKSVLRGARQLLENGKIKKIAVCTYHKQDDEIELGKLLQKYTKTPAKGYMLGALVHEIYDIKPPYLTKGLIRATLKQ